MLPANILATSVILYHITSVYQNAMFYVTEQKVLRAEREQQERELRKRLKQQEKQLKREAYEAMKRQKMMMAEETDKALKGMRYFVHD